MRPATPNEAFINEAEILLEKRNADLTSVERRLLEAVVGRMTDGTERLSTPESVHDWLARLRDHYP